MHLCQSRLYYGWVVVAIGFITMLFIMGTFFSSGVLFAAIVAEYGWSRASVSLPFSVALVVYAGTAWLAGQLFDRHGPRRLFPLGAICTGIGLIASAHVRTPWQLCIAWGLLVAQGFNLAGIAPHLALVALWFNQWRGLASGLVLSGSSVGALVIVPLSQYLVDAHGWRSAYTLLGTLVLMCLVPLNAFGQQHRPADMGRHPDGVFVPPGATLRHPPFQSSTPCSLWHMLGTTRFWLLFVVVCCLGWLSNITSVHQIAYIISQGFPGMLAAFIVSVLSLLRAVSSTIWGGLSDRMGREAVFTIGTIFCIVGLVCLSFLRQPTSTWPLYGYALAFGVGYGVYGAVYAAATADLFASSRLGTILGLLELGWGLGGFGGSWVGGYWYDRWGSYQGAFILTVGVSLLGCLAMWLAAPRRMRNGSLRCPAGP